ncbi:hypothetical protein DPMN_079009 [Dreissena polymorpha]|uniref:Uncharacterized protein n=1 Tax=Dreissena polymorpha TaxID=45954 RepID=A0A9D3YNA8_DREPO|nr:hypothetical protein DPMN_079009 [Dreissena polymorpha]
MPVASRQSAGLPMYRSYRDSAGIHRGNTGDRVVAVALKGSVWAPVELRFRPGCHGAVLVVAGAAPVVVGPSLQYYPGGAPVVPVRPRFIPVVPGGALVHPGRFRITHRGSTGIIVRLGLYEESQMCKT